MEERYDNFLCPNCGKEMHKGVSTKSQRPWLDWFPGRRAPSIWKLSKVPDAKKQRTCPGAYGLWEIFGPGIWTITPPGTATNAVCC